MPPVGLLKNAAPSEVSGSTLGEGTVETQKLTSLEVDEMLEGLRIIDADSHFTEPSDLWSSRLPASLRDKAPVQKTVDGETSWFLDGEPWAGLGGNVIRRNREKVLGQFVVQPFEEIDPCAWDVTERLRLLDELGIYAQVLYPNGIGFASNHIFAIEDPKVRLMVLQTYNDFLMDVQSEAMSRLFPQAMLPIWDMDLTVAEMTRCIDGGITGFTLSDKPELLGLSELNEPYFEPMWDTFNNSGTVANFHIASGNRREEREAARRIISAGLPGQGRGSAAEAALQTDTRPAALRPDWNSLGRQRRLVVMGGQSQMSNMRVISNLCLSDLFDRFPRLKVVSAESGIGWVPFLLENLEWHFDQLVTDADEKARTARRPMEYFRDHIAVMFWFERVAPERLIDEIGVNNVMVETDIPHPTCYYPGPREHFAEVLKGVSPATRRRVLQDNAAEWYGIPLPAPAISGRG